MEVLKKSKRVSWAPDEYLCEVKPVLKTDCPSRIGTIPSLYGSSPSLFTSTFAKYARVYGDIWKERTPRRLQSSHDEEEKVSTTLQSSHDEEEKVSTTLQSSHDEEGKVSTTLKSSYGDECPEIPPGFENVHNADDDGRLKRKCPPNPKMETCCEWNLPQVQLASTYIPVVEAPASDIPSNEKSPATDIVAVYVAALTAILKAKKEGASMDTDVLVKILSDPKMIEKLSDVDGVVASSSIESALSNTVTAPMVAAKPVTTAPVPIISMPEIHNLIKDQAKNNAANSRGFQSIPNTQPNSFNMVLQPSLVTMPAQPSLFPVPSYAANAMTTNPTPTKDSHYYLNLIKEYGGNNKQETPNCSVLQSDSYQNQLQNIIQKQNLKPVDSKTKSRKRCKFFFRSGTGCLNGSKCLYRHDISAGKRTGATLESTRAKKMKLKSN